MRGPDAVTDPISILTRRLAPAFARVADGADPAVRRSDRSDYQADGALALAKRLGRNPREVAVEVAAAADLDDLVETMEVAGPGFLNLRLRSEALAALVREMAGDDRLGIAAARSPETVVVDYSAPNVAKEMHVGHLRSTIIGDALVRLEDFLGHTVVRQNHLGDWGTPFGMLIEHLLDIGEDEAVAELSVGDLNRFYQEGRAKFDSDPAFAERSRLRVVALQSGDQQTLRLWHLLYEQSRVYFQQVYDRLGVLLTPDDDDGESRYNPMLASVVEELDRLGLLQESDGALCVFPPGFTNRDGEPLPMIVRKADGGYGYSATDLATIRFRVQKLGATRLLYVVGAPQRDHLEMLFAVARMACWLDERHEATHVAFGSVLGTDRKVLRTRAGVSVKLMDLLDEAVARARALLAERRPDLEPAEAAELAEAVGIGAVKYADLANDRVRDYVFDFDRMLSFEGNTAPYLQYANTRIRSIFRRAGESPDPAAPVELHEPAERALALHLLGFEEAVRLAAERSHPHRLCTYLYQLASAFTTFYETCPVLQADNAALRASRLLLCDLSSRVLSKGMELLGIQAPEQM
jgi:arginyl-tRNA synthetase